MSAVFEAIYANPTDFYLLILAKKGIYKKVLITLVKQISLTLKGIAKVFHIQNKHCSDIKQERCLRQNS